MRQAHSTGYCLTGSIREQCFFVWYGSGANGKSTMLGVVRALLGDLHYAAPAVLFQQQRSPVHSSYIMGLMGARIIAVAETEQGHRIDEARVKHITGGEPMTGRRLFATMPTTFPIVGKLIWCTNHLPTIQSQGHAMWRRVRLVRFGVQIPKEEEDPNLLDKLIGELDGILAWCVRGTGKWLEDGLNPPAAVTVATRQYQRAEDRIQQFFDDECVIEVDAQVSRCDLAARFSAWLNENGEGRISLRAFYSRLRDLGYGETRTLQDGRAFQGLKLAVDGLSHQETLSALT